LPQAKEEQMREQQEAENLREMYRMMLKRQ
jgi:hypothetical protein